MTKEIQLTRGMVALVDDDDYRWASLCTWQCMKAGYAAMYSYKVHYYMHRLIMNAPKGLIVDHINSNRLDNRKENLRLTTQGKNTWNQSMQKKKKYSIYKGVSWSKAAKKWVASIQKEKKTFHLGLYEIEYLAALAYNKAALELFGEYSKINVIDETQ